MFNLIPFNKFIYNRRVGVAYRFHPIIEAEYYEESPAVNRSFVVGVDSAGGIVTGIAVTSAEANLVGERLYVCHDPAITSATAAGYAAASVLAKARFDGRLAKITIPPHCGLELWDVVSIADIPGDISADYRVASYILKYSPAESHFYHEIGLCAP